MPCVTGAKLYGPSSLMPGGVSYLQNAETTYNHAFEQWDSTCGGGIYWSRDRASTNINMATYKSTITNLEWYIP